MATNVYELDLYAALSSYTYFVRVFVRASLRSNSNAHIEFFRKNFNNFYCNPTFSFNFSDPPNNN